MGQKVTFDGINKIIQVDAAPTLVGGQQVVELDVKADLYSDGKEDWLTDPALSKLRFPIRSIGGNPLPGSKALGSTFFLSSSWKIRPYEASHVFRVNGNLYSEDGTSPFVSTIGIYSIFLEQQVSSLVDSTVQQLAEIEYASFSGGVTYQADSPYYGTEYPVGTPREPVNNLSDAMSIAQARGFTTIFIIDDAVINTGGDYSGVVFIGASKMKSEVTVTDASNVSNCEFFEMHLSGILDGDCSVTDCVIGNLNYITGFIEQCVLSAGTIVLGQGAVAHFLDCWSGVPGPDVPIIDLGGSGQSLALRNYNGGVKLINKTGTDPVSIDLNAGQVRIDLSTVTNGTIIIRGQGSVVDDSNDSPILTGTYEDLIVVNQTVSVDNISNTVWGHSTGINVLEDVVKGRKMQTNKAVISEDGRTVSIYDDDGTTLLHQFDVSVNKNIRTPV